MAKRNTQQLGGRKEAPLAVGGSGNVAQEQERAVFVPNDAEYHRYSELLKGFFEKLIRLQGVLSAEEYLREEERRSGIVFRLDTGLIMTPVTSKEKYNPANKILKISNFTDRHPKPGLFGTRVFISSAPAGKHLLVDPSGK